MREKRTRVLVILVIMMMVFALMPVQTVWAEDHLCPECGQPGVFDPSIDPTEYACFFRCTNNECNTIVFSSWHTGGEATCTAKAVCEFCGREYGDLKQHTGGTATCKAKAVCENCQQEYGELDPNNHTGTSTVTGEKEATCTEAGYTGDTTWDCCGKKVEGETIAALGHKGGTATCTAKAVCETCGQEYGEVLGHKWGAWTVTKEATTSEEGIETRVCSNDSSHIETRKIAKKEETKKEEPKKEAAKAETVSKTTDTQPQTGDENQTVWVIMMMLSAAILIVLAIRKRRVFD